MQEFIFIRAPLLALHNYGLNQILGYQLCSQQEFAPSVMCDLTKEKATKIWSEVWTLLFTY